MEAADGVSTPINQTQRIERIAQELISDQHEQNLQVY